jgi:DNA-binding FadR family transcriptional regulator
LRDQAAASAPPGAGVTEELRGTPRSPWGPGEALPSIVALAAEYRVTTDTVQKGLRILKAEGLVTSVPGYGTFVAE